MSLATLLGSAIAEAAPDQAGPPDVQLSVQVDRTTVDVGEQLALTITVEGNVQQVELEPVEFPKAFRVVAQSRSTHLAMEAGQVKRSISLVYALTALEPGQFTLGPFEARRRGQSLLSDPLEITVNKPALPPTLEPSERFVL
ncbi:MAG: hypothetical protein A3I71_07630 [Omnitrophica WOR_2 bacterium RIFCSPLOWO2_02_FULL_63_16]|nr:MAG: hypothetical protein A2Z92_03975 [Omnitrophica WOR_2 bacterium GWA2_63_20]OGX16139.1 MAG: hypothetical protein A2105_07185 [Omnitrophica WOR_2 bacterium GWF2_63_9]OGX31274.1 MAG: hypothetical protein A3E56_04475 [Omnitrophica WOR_2 bacterium RIFCSPHIGHO2_12_FULL_64_13]OGX36519.1 MAG: hypothetical protein A3B73_03895 [Omnitrophica WOR_2 bacterium RIFCSPHIGHO2_02_FULL_63_39]OGX46267.1 MAG: hypothetical protein A3I71_07630 [Omnitrophica WOR_2 bacterium RIFCSPLOWO2_02_FULL_63_16]OGX47045.1